MIAQSLTEKKVLPGQLLDIGAVAARLSLTKDGVRQLLRRGDLPSVKLSERRCRIPEAAVVDYVARRTG